MPQSKSNSRKGLQEFVEQWPSVVLSGEEYCANLFRHEDGRLHVYFNQPNTSVRYSTNDSTRLGFRVFDSRAMFLGIKVASNLRGGHVGTALLRYFMGEAENRGLSVSRTGLIHKPLVALMLKRSGFSPVSTKAVAEILPESGNQPDHHPKICWLSNTLPPEECVDGIKGRKFYDVVTVPEATFRYPLCVPETNQVALHTPYVRTV